MATAIDLKVQVTRRDAQLSDFPLFEQWWKEPVVYSTMPHPYNKPRTSEEVMTWLETYLDDRDHKYCTLAIVCFSGRPIGFQLSRDYISGIPEVGIIIVDPEFRDKGIGALFSDAVGMNILKSRGFTKVRATVRKDNTKTLHFLEKFGYEEIYEGEDYKVFLRSI